MLPGTEVDDDNNVATSTESVTAPTTQANPIGEWKVPLLPTHFSKPCLEMADNSGNQ